MLKRQFFDFCIEWYNRSKAFCLFPYLLSFVGDSFVKRSTIDNSIIILMISLIINGATNNPTNPGNNRNLDCLIIRINQHFMNLDY